MNKVACWRLSANASIAWKCWDKECVLHDAVTGDTHLIPRYAAAVLDRLETPLTHGHAFDTLSIDLAEDDLEAVLADFESRKFICRV